MGTKEILKFCIERGFLLDRDVLELFSGTSDIDVETSKLIIEKIGQFTQKRVITKSVFEDNKDKLDQILLNLPEENQRQAEKLKIKLGLSIEISREIIKKDISSEGQRNDKVEKGAVYETTSVDEKGGNSIKIMSMNQISSKKLEVADFVKHFRSRFFEMSNLLRERAELENLISINKISGNSNGVSIIGIVSGKRITKNKNMLIELEDLTGKIVALVNINKPELFKKAENIALDSVIAVKGSGSREIVFVNDIFFPDSRLQERKKSPEEEYALFTGDLHFGSKRFLEESFLKFINYLNGDLKGDSDSEVEKIKYLFLVGDVVTGVGNYPNQEADLKIVDLEEQFIGLANLLKKIRRDIKIIISPGNHDGVRLMEPQPFLDEKYAWPLYDLDNVILTGNPCLVNIGAKKSKKFDFPGFNVLTYHGFSFAFYANNISELMLKRAMNSPEDIMKYLLQNRHLAPTHASVQYSPLEKDSLFIKEVPDIFVSGHTHKSAVSYYNNILLISSSCWEAMTPYQEKFGNEPDHCKVPMFNLKTREVKILDFE